jgi:hypothetical protein
LNLLVALLAIVSAIDDGEKIPRDARAPIPDAADKVELFGMRDEVVAFQVAIEGPAERVTVEVDGLPPEVLTERFVEHFFEVKRSSTAGHDYSLGWASGSGPRGKDYTGWLPDALIPVELAPAWEPWPMKIAAGQRGAVWIDVTIPPEIDTATYHGKVTVRAGDKTLATLPLDLEVLPATLPERPVKTLVFYDPGALRKRVGNLEATELQTQMLLRSHKLTPLRSVGSLEDVHDLSDDVVVLGTYGTLGDPTPDKVALVEQIADALDAQAVFDHAEVILYAEDENCKSPRGAGWKSALAASKNANARRVKVAWTCSEDPAKQPVDLPIVAAGDWRPPSKAWIYNGQRPATGTMLTDTEAVSMRTYGWIAAMAQIPRWFIWESTFWYDGNNGGKGPYDPFVSAETFHNKDGEASMGDGVLLYPGRQIDRFPEHSIGLDGVVPSIRLKNLRRGVEDAGYFELASEANRAGAEKVARGLLPKILAEARDGDRPSWPERGRPFREARLALGRLIGTGHDPGKRSLAGGGDPRQHGPKIRLRYVAAVIILLVGGIGYARRRRQQRR